MPSKKLIFIYLHSPVKNPLPVQSAQPGDKCIGASAFVLLP
ncbi:hypothetical protein HMPREF1548_05971 [Clostridium sp. KLE 1755]|jgi:hypothetical protein|nr:hypothetical protein HMPREF1548_05971 [Clostridium sp. KLE 1755]